MVRNDARSDADLPTGQAGGPGGSRTHDLGIKSPVRRILPGFFRRLPTLAAPVIRDCDCLSGAISATK